MAGRRKKSNFRKIWYSPPLSESTIMYGQTLLFILNVTLINQAEVA